MTMKREWIQAFYDEPTGTMTYVVWDPRTQDAVVIDPLVNYDPTSQLVTRASLEQVLRFVREKQLRLHWVLETHVHADHLSAARHILQEVPGCGWAMSAKMRDVYQTFKKVYSWPAAELSVGDVRWLRDEEELSAGSLRIRALNTPGHTPACMTFRIGENLFTGDALMMPDYGVGRCDFPGGSAAQLYDSIWGRLYALPDHLQVFVGHDYRPGGRPLAFQASLGAQKDGNIHLKASTSRGDFVQFRESRDRTLTAPRLLHPSLDWNLGVHQVVKLAF